MERKLAAGVLLALVALSIALLRPEAVVARRGTSSPASAPPTSPVHGATTSPPRVGAPRPAGETVAEREPDALRVTVLEEGRPARAQVSLRRDVTGEEDALEAGSRAAALCGDAYAEAETDARGVASLPRVAEEAHFLVAESESGIAVARVTGQDRERLLELAPRDAPRPGFGAIRVTVTRSGRAMGGAVGACLSRAGCDACVPGVLDAGGAFTIPDVPPGAWKLCVDRTRHSLATDEVVVRVEAGRIAHVTVDAPAAGSLSGRVDVGGRGHRSSIAVRGLDSSFWESRSAPEDGHYSREGLEPGRYEVSVRCRGTATVTRTVVVLPLEETVVPDVVLGAGARLSGRVVSLHGEVMPGVVATVDVAGVEGDAVTDAEGRFEIEGLPAGRGTLRVQAHHAFTRLEGTSPAYLEALGRALAPTSPVAVERGVVLPETGSVDVGDVSLGGGRVEIAFVASAAPAGARVELVNETSALELSRAGDRFVGYAPPGVYRVLVNDGGFQRGVVVPGAVVLESPRAVEVREATTTALELPLVPTRTTPGADEDASPHASPEGGVRVRVRAPGRGTGRGRGKPVVSVTVLAGSVEGRPRGRGAEVGDEALVGRLEPGSVTVLVFSTRFPLQTVLVRQVVVQARSTVELDADWPEARLLAVSGRTSPGATVIARGAGLIQTVTARSDGTFTLELPEGTYEVARVQADGLGPASRVVLAGGPTGGVLLP